MNAAVLASLESMVGPLDWTAAGRILLAALLGGIIGWERERHGRAAGLRTHLLLGVGCCLAMLVSLYLPAMFAQQYAGGTVVRVDPGRVAASVLTGLGFLGAGAIIVLGQHIRGLTTAACIWVSAVIGLAVGAGYILPALATFLVAMFALLVLGRLEKWMRRKDQYIQLRLRFSGEGTHAEAVRRLLARRSFAVLQCTTDWDEEGTLYKLALRYSREPDFEEVTRLLRRDLAGSGLKLLQWI